MGTHAGLIAISAILLSAALLAFTLWGRGTDELVASTTSEALGGGNQGAHGTTSVDFSDMYNHPVWSGLGASNPYGDVGSQPKEPNEYTGTGPQTIAIEKPGGATSPAWVTYELIPLGSEDAEATFSGGSRPQDINVTGAGNPGGAVAGSIWLDDNTSAGSTQLDVKATGHWKITLHSIEAAPVYSGREQFTDSGNRAFIHNAAYTETSFDLLHTPGQGVDPKQLPEFTVSSVDDLVRLDALPGLIYSSELPAADTTAYLGRGLRLITVQGEGYDWWMKIRHSDLSLDTAGTPYELQGGELLTDNTGPTRLTRKDVSPPAIIEYKAHMEAEARTNLDKDHAYPEQKFGILAVGKNGSQTIARELGHVDQAYRLFTEPVENLASLNITAEGYARWSLTRYPLSAAPQLTKGSAYRGSAGSGAGLFYWPGSEGNTLSLSYLATEGWGVGESSVVIYPAQDEGIGDPTVVYRSSYRGVEARVSLPTKPGYVMVNLPTAGTWTLSVE